MIAVAAWLGMVLGFGYAAVLIARLEDRVRRLEAEVRYLKGDGPPV